MNGNKKSKKISVKIIRWIGVLPAFVFGLFLACLISKVTYGFIDFWGSSETLSHLNFANLVYGIVGFVSVSVGSFFAGFVPVFVGAAIAPRHRRIVAIILCTILSILFILSLFGYMDMGFYGSKIKSAIIVIVVIAGGIMGVKSAYDEFDE